MLKRPRCRAETGLAALLMGLYLIGILAALLHRVSGANASPLKHVEHQSGHGEAYMHVPLVKHIEHNPPSKSDLMDHFFPDDYEAEER